MTGWLNQDFRFGLEVNPNLPWSNGLASQGSTLVNNINSAGGTGYILIGHSQGGLVSRSAAQQYQSGSQNQTTVKGVVTLDTPNQGAPIAVTGGVAINQAVSALSTWLWNWTGCFSAYDNWVCYIAAVAYVAAPVVAQELYYSYADIQDLTPGSSFLNQLNGFSEKFVQAGVVSNTPLWFDETRILWDALFLRFGCYPESGCGERNVALITQGVFVEVVFLEAFCIFEEIFDPNNFDYWAAEAEYFAGILVGMESIDVYWNVIVSGYQSSDALVPTSSQNYPASAAVQYPIYSADSHTAATTSPNVHNTLYSVLSGPQFRVQTQASCSFLTSPSSESVAPGAASYSIGLSTGPGCQWSAVSGAPWITITSGSSGTSSGNISFSVGANPSSNPRMGTIQAGNGGSTATFTLTQAATCSYSLSTTNVIFQPGGGTATVSVTTQTGCVWSAVPSASWITITAGGGGTASGSFTFTAAPPDTTNSFTGTIRVMGQVLNIIVGSAFGTPGTGTITISGSPQSGTFNMCPNTYPYSCWTTIQEGGQISVMIEGFTYGTGYGSSSDTASQLARNLANSINGTSGSPVTATVSGSTVTVTSIIKGAVTNYPITSSYQFGPPSPYFSNPAFTAAALGISGGTD